MASQRSVSVSWRNGQGSSDQPPAASLFRRSFRRLPSSIGASPAISGRPKQRARESASATVQETLQPLTADPAASVREAALQAVYCLGVSLGHRSVAIDEPTELTAAVMGSRLLMDHQPAAEGKGD